MFKLLKSGRRNPMLINGTSWNKNLCDLFFSNLEKSDNGHSFSFLLSEQRSELNHNNFEHTYHGDVQAFSIPDECLYTNVLVNLYFYKTNTIRNDSPFGYATFGNNLTQRKDAHNGRLPSIEISVLDNNNLSENLSSLFAQVKAGNGHGVEVAFNIDLNNVIQMQKIGDEEFDFKWIKFKANLK